MLKKGWIVRLRKYCGEYNIPPEYLPNTLYESKVVPMIRGKAFEFSAFLAVKNILVGDWVTEKVDVNAEFGFGDVDLSIKNNKTGKKILAECKLAKKEGFSKVTGGYQIIVKCMRSRTLGEAMVSRVARRLHLPEALLTIHNDQYLPKDFDIVITSIGNTFYRTKELKFVWSPTNTEKAFLKGLAEVDGKSKINLKDFAFSKMYVAISSKLNVSKENGVICSRHRCYRKKSCGFIPNYPKITFKEHSLKPEPPWFELSDISLVLNEMAGGSAPK